ncbi:response regulator [Magnetospira sp. QH-2]|uniref:response regulator n=1 Tax=Magnetospira sp. (strain QH-2) TaxID=1288970 RepID=UPI0005FA8CF0|nr:response regulator [Magnetospira sp. QH-2]
MARVLIIDDDFQFCEMIREMIVSVGHETVVAHSGGEAMDRIEAQCFDLVVADIVMPGGNGAMVVRRLKQECPDTKIIVLTGYKAMSRLVERGALEGVDVLFQKPIPMDAFLADVERLIAA